MLPDDPRHASEAGFEQHVRDDEDPCDPCYNAKLVASRRRTKRKTMGYKYTVDSAKTRARLTEWRGGGASYGEIADHVGIEESRIWEILNNDTPRIYTRTARAILSTKGWPVTAATVTRRIRALCRLGYGLQQIADAAGVHHDTVLDARRKVRVFLARKVRDGIVAAYDQLHMTLPPTDTARERAGVTRVRNHAERQGWRAPMSYDDIDNPHDQPTNHVRRTAAELQQQVDVAVVLRLVDECARTRPLTRAEAAEACRILLARGHSTFELKETWGLKPERYKPEEAA